MEQVKIDTVRGSLINQHTTPARVYSWQSLSNATISRATPTLFDELLIVFDTPDGPVYATEVDPGFARLNDALSLDKQLPEDWYIQVEAGLITIKQKLIPTTLSRLRLIISIPALKLRQG